MIPPLKKKQKSASSPLGATDRIWNQICCLCVYIPSRRTDLSMESVLSHTEHKKEPQNADIHAHYVAVCKVTLNGIKVLRKQHRIGTHTLMQPVRTVLMAR